MKKIIFLIAVTLSIGISAQAQKKLGYVNSQELLSLMPEAKAADNTLDSFQKNLQDQYKALADEGQKKFQEYQDNEKTWSAAVKETKEEELKIDEIDKLFSTHIRTFQNWTIGFVTINTAWCSTGDDDKNNLFFHCIALRDTYFQSRNNRQALAQCHLLPALGILL